MIELKRESDFVLVVNTKFLGPTNHLGSRVKAWDIHGEVFVTLNWRHELPSSANHVRAANNLLDKMIAHNRVGLKEDAPRRWIGESGMKGYVFVLDLKYNG